MKSLEAKLSTADSYLWFPFLLSKSHSALENRLFCLFLTNWLLILVVTATSKPGSNPSTNSMQIFWKTVTAKAGTGCNNNAGFFQRTVQTYRSCCKKTLCDKNTAWYHIAAQWLRKQNMNLLLEMHSHRETEHKTLVSQFTNFWMFLHLTSILFVHTHRDTCKQVKT